MTEGLEVGEGFVVGWKVGHGTRPDAVVLLSLKFWQKDGILFCVPNSRHLGFESFRNQYRVDVQVYECG